MNTVRIHNPHNVFLYDNTNILPGFIFISHRGQFFFHQGSAAAQNLTVVTDSHIRKVGKLFKDEELFYKYKDNISENVVVEEDVWIGTNVTLLPGVTIGRGSNVGAWNCYSRESTTLFNSFWKSRKGNWLYFYTRGNH
ncbi:hypothetical protein NXX60_03570 [Bacteroides thetaiotaomicron]|nr:hypothetical protein NXX60_03570 [Bacteroides thetaiotaomicron]